MDIKTAQFKGSFPKVEQCPALDQPEYAFIGRSNVGKSSLINKLLKRKQLAKVSSTPGKTQMLNYFHIDDLWYLVDLPGYGYAKLSKVKRRSLANMIEGYLMYRANMQNAFVLIDGNVPPQAMDLDFIKMLGLHGIPFSIVFTKLDKKKIKIKDQFILAFIEELATHWDPLPPLFYSSAKTGVGCNELLTYIREMNQLYSTRSVDSG